MHRVEDSTGIDEDGQREQERKGQTDSAQRRDACAALKPLFSILVTL
jgi:hypothetical protein